MKYVRLTKKEKLIATTTKGPVYSNIPERDELYNRLAELEDKIEDGTLIELHKDSVVLSREKYEAYKKLAEAVYEEGAFNHYDDVINSAKIMFKDRKKLVKDTSKETAEKIFKMLISKLESNQFLSGNRIIMEVDVENLAKQFDVEIEG